MSILFILLLACFAFLALYIFKKQYQRSSNEPPLFAGLPYMGHAIPYGKHPLNFQAECRKKVGDLYTVYLAGQRLTLLHDVLLYPAIFKSSSQWDFNFFARDISQKAFAITHDTYDKVDKAFHKQYNTFLAGTKLQPLTLSLQKRLYQHMVQSGQEKLKQWTTADLYGWTKYIIFYGSGDSIFGDDFSNPAALAEFLEFDSKFAMFLAGLPKFLFQNAANAHNKLIERLHGTWEHQSTWMSERVQVAKDLGLASQQVAALQTSILWASQANTVPAAFWIIAHVLADKEARKEIVEEIENVMETAERDGNIVIFSSEKLAAMVKLDSAISEALRIHSAPVMVRKATDEAELTLTSGATYTVRKDDILMLSPYWTHHDPEIYKNPEEFQFKRYLGDPKFYKNGQIVKTPLLPFGGGISLCPGRHFARNEMKVFVAFAMYYFDMELVNPSAPLPSDDFTRAGLGTMPPVHDIQFRYRLKESIFN